MNPVARAVPRDPVDVTSFIDNFRAEHGIAPFGGGESVPGAPPAQAAPPPAPAPAPAPQLPGGVDPAQVQPAPQPQYQQPDPAAAAQQPQAPAAPPAQQPDWMQPLIERMDRVAPPQEYDPIAAELGLAPAPPLQPNPQMPQQPPASPAQPQQTQQPGMPFPGAQPDQQQQLALIQQWIAEEAQKAAQSVVDPRFEALQHQQRLEEYQGLRSDYEEFRDPVRGSQIVSQARQWAARMGSPEMAQDPMFLEMTLMASRQMDAARLAQAQQPVPPAVPGQPLPPGAQQPYPIEQPGPAAPAPQSTPQQEIAKRISQAGGSRLSPLWA
jgi:hypothetical protein